MIETLTIQQQESERQARLNEPGTGPACPFCHLPRQERSDYLRCNPCGVNWLDEEMHLPNYINLDPRTARRVAALTGGGTKPIAERSAEDAEA